jgi:hypothetical protein
MTEPVTGGSAPLVELAEFSRNLGDPMCLKVAKLEPFNKDGRQLVRVELEDRPPGHPVYRKISVELSSVDYSPVHAESVTKLGQTGLGDAVMVHDPHKDVPLLMSTRSQSHEDDGSPTTSVLTVTERRFGSIPEDQFTPERAFDGAPAHRIIAKPELYEGPELVKWYPLPVVLGLASFVAGACGVPWARRQK